MPDAERSSVRSFSRKEWILPAVRIAISFAAGAIGYFSAKTPEVQIRFVAAYAGWSWVWGLILLYPAFVARVESERFVVLKAYGLFFWGTFYICVSMLAGFLGGGIYRFVKDVIALRRAVQHKNPENL